MSENNANFFQKNAEVLVLTGLVVMCAAVFGQTVGFAFINFDDNLYVYDNPAVRAGVSWNSIKWAFTAFYSANWHPITWLSHMIDVSLFDANPGAHHATNVIFHIVNSFLAFVVFRKMTGCVWKSAIVAALFAVHPAHVESVAWISERKDVLSTMFWLLTMLAYFGYVRLQQGRPQTDEDFDESETVRRFFYFLTVALFALGLMSKPMLVTLPFVLLLCDFWALERLKKLKDLVPLIIEKLPLFILSAVSAYITIAAQRSYGAVQTLETLPIPTRLLNAVVSYAKYVITLFYPVNLGIAYPYRETFPAWQIFGSFVLLAGVTAFCIAQRKKRKYLLMGWLWFLGTLVPVIGIVQVGAQSMADRYSYVPYFGLFIMLVWSAGEIFSRFKINRAVIAGIAVIVLGALCFLGFKQASYWQNAETLYSHTLAAGQGNFLIKVNYCNFLLRENRLQEAEKQCLDSIAENPNFAEAFTTIGVVYVKAGKYEDAVQNFRRSIQINPNDPAVYTNLGAPLAMLGRIDEAAHVVGKAAELYKRSGADPAVLNGVYANLAAAYGASNEFDKAAEILARVLKNSPGKTDLRINYALMLYSQNKLDEAKLQIDQAIAQSPETAESYNLLGMIFVKQNNRAEAAAQFEKALELKPDYNEASENLRHVKDENTKQ